MRQKRIFHARHSTKLVRNQNQNTDRLNVVNLRTEISRSFKRNNNRHSDWHKNFKYNFAILWQPQSCWINTPKCVKHQWLTKFGELILKKTTTLNQLQQHGLHGLRALSSNQATRRANSIVSQPATSGGRGKCRDFYNPAKKLDTHTLTEIGYKRLPKASLTTLERFWTLSRSLQQDLKIHPGRSYAQRIIFLCLLERNGQWKFWGKTPRTLENNYFWPKCHLILKKKQ